MLCFQAQKDYKFQLILLDERKFQFTYKGNQNCHQLLNDTVKLFNFNHEEMEYFGFRFIDSNSQSHWVDLDKTIQSQFKSQSESHSDTANKMVIYFSVKYYQPDPCKLKESTRYLFYLQLRKDILLGRLPLQFDYAVDLFSYFMQSELGDYNPDRDTRGYASEYQFIPNQTIELENATETKHSKLKGMNQATAEMNFLNKAKWLEMYGVDLQPVVDSDNIEYFIGLTPTGISVYQNKIKINSYFWPRISKLNYKGNRFVLTVIENTSEEKSHVFVLGNKASCKSLWKNCVDHHNFFRIKTVYEEPAKLSTAVITNKRKSTTEGAIKVAINRIPTKKVPRRKFDNFNKIDEDAMVIDVNKICLTERIENNNLIFKPIENLMTQNGLFSSSGNINEIPNIATKQASPTASAKSVSSYKCPNPRRESASEAEIGGRRRYGSRNRSRTRHNPEEKKDDKKNETNSENENVLKDNKMENKENNEPNRRSSGRHKRRSHRSHSRGSTKTTHPDWTSLSQKNDARSKSRKSLNYNHASGANLIGRGHYYEASCNETSMDENDINEMEKKRQIRRRKRSKSPGAVTKPPEEILQHIKYNLVEQTGLNADQLKEIPFVKIETSAAPFRISPHQKHRRYSPGRRRSGEFHDSKSNVAYLSNGTAHVKKTKNKFLENLDSGVAVPNVSTNPVSMGSAVNTKLNSFPEQTGNIAYSNFGEPQVNIGFSADSGCEDMLIKPS